MENNLSDMDVAYNNTIEMLKAMDPKKDRFETYCMLRILVGKIVLDFQTFKSMFNDWTLMNNFTDEQMKGVFDDFKELSMMEVTAMKNLMKSKPVKEAYDMAMAAISRMTPECRPLPEKTIYIDQSNNPKLNKEVEK